MHHTNAVFEPRVVPRWEQLMGIPCKRKDEMDEKNECNELLNLTQLFEIFESLEGVGVDDPLCQRI